MAPPRRLLLHGTLEAMVFRAENISDPHRPTAWLPFGDILQGVEATVGVGRGRTQIHVELGLDGAPIGRTDDADVVGSQSTTWFNETVRAHCAHTAAELVFSVMILNDKATLAVQPDTTFGRAYLPVQDLLASPGREVQRSFPVLDHSSAARKELPGRPRVELRVKFHPAATDAAAGGVPHTFFPPRPGCKVTLYQDAHVHDSFAPRIPLAGGGRYEPARCWEDVFDAISGARDLVYVAGWSVYTEIRLLRDGGAAGATLTLGELLKRKAGEGVRVLLMVWDDPSSLQALHDYLGVRWSKMQTHDQDTARYFRGDGGVHCVLVPRHTLMLPSFHPGMERPKHELPSLLDTHHQKTIVVDHHRHVVAFVGGIDLCDGRYDTPTHSLFRTLDKEHRDDFHQPSVPDAAVELGGPREPWHDVHSKIQGPAAWDVLRNFEQRWRRKKQGGDPALLVDLDDLERRGQIMPASSEALAPGDAEEWSVQVFRSIDSTSAVGLEAGDGMSMDERIERGLVCGRNITVERSVQDAYIHAIRRATRFVYIENQYFIGSSFQWRGPGSITRPIDAAAPPLNLVPRELSLKIASKIDAGERFAAYVVLPMWPEGFPGDETTQEILNWQRKTMEMMYGDVAAALRRKGVRGANPREYLAFFCLGNREAAAGEGGGDEYQPPHRPAAGTHYARAQEARRFMIYVHSKTMIVDDEYVIVGSANINQRSMDGAKDTEIAMGAYQPHHLNGQGGDAARGQVHGFRMSLWYEHLGGGTVLQDNEEFLDPASLECVRKVNRMADDNWRLYAQDAPLDHDLPGHLLPYPITVTDDGVVGDLTECFPDTQAPVRGKIGEGLASGAYITSR